MARNLSYLKFICRLTNIIYTYHLCAPNIYIYRYISQELMVENVYFIILIFVYGIGNENIRLEPFVDRGTFD